MDGILDNQSSSACKRGIHHNLRCREYGKSSRFSAESLPDKLRKKLNSDYCNVIRYVRDLKSAVQSKGWTNIENVVTDLMKILVDQTGVNEVVGAAKRQMRHTFVAYGGMDYLLQILLAPISPSDARNWTKSTFRDKAETWNELLLIIRELVVSIPSLPDRYFTLDHIKFIFTLIHHTSVFESAVSTIEEILACREDPFPLYVIPNFFGLLKGLASRHLAHFCRLLSLTIFEPEDRHILEGTQVLRSLDLLRIRRTRMFRSSNFVVEKNQNLLVQMPDFLPRLTQILRVINHGPQLSEFTRRNIIAQLPISTDVLNFSSSLAGVDDWEHFRRLEKAIADSDLESQTPRSPSSPTPSTATSAVATELLDALTPSAPSGALEMGNLVRVMLLAERLGIAEISPLGQAFLFTQHLPELEGQDSLAELQQRLLRSRLRRSYGGSSVGELTAERAKNEMLFHALILAPHQIEIIFVMCTLLSGRRKIFVQDWLLQLGLDKVLINLFDRMSWDAPPFSGPNAMEHIHGPTCECNPENAVRVQVLRLIHNFYDRDFLGNPNKFALLSPDEQEFFLRIPDALADAGEGLQAGALTLAKKGLMSRIIDILDKQSKDSQYRFWLSACIENFLRGCGRRGQVFVTERGLLLSTVKSIFDAGEEDNAGTKSEDVNAYQTAFDLVGEIIKCNPRILELLEAELSDEEFRALIRVCLDHLVDSNVFLRSLFLTIEMYHMSVSHPQGVQCFEHFGFVENALTAKNEDIPRNQLCFGYLTATWSQENPPVCNSALQQYRDKKDLQERRARAARSAKTRASGGVKVKVGSNTLTSLVNSGVISGATSISNNNRSPAAEKPSNQSASTNSPNFIQNIVNGVGGFVSSLASAASSNAKQNSKAENQSSKDIWDASEVLVVPSAESKGGVKALVESQASDGIFYTPPEGPHFTRSSKTPNLPEEELTIAVAAASQSAKLAGELSLDTLSVAINNILDEATERQQTQVQEMEKPFMTPKGTTEMFTPDRKGKKSITQIIPKPPAFPNVVASPLSIQPKIFRFSMFLIQEKFSILLRLMSTVSISSINHENICCLNSSLLMLLFDLKRNQLGQTLEKLRRLADEIDPVIPAFIAERKMQRRKKSSSVVPMLCVHLLSSDSANASSVAGSSCGCSIPGCVAYGGNGDNSTIPAMPSASTGNNRKSKKEAADDALYKKNLKRVAEDQAVNSYQRLSRQIEPSEEDGQNGEHRDLSNGTLVMMNYRELLWYWREYYLRRGRDRLSIEFSSHITFSHFLNLVDMLCADDGSETALLSAPMELPQSPYEYSNLQCLLESRSLVRSSIIHL